MLYLFLIPITLAVLAPLVLAFVGLFSILAEDATPESAPASSQDDETTSS